MKITVQSKGGNIQIGDVLISENTAPLMVSGNNTHYKLFNLENGLFTCYKGTTINELMDEYIEAINGEEYIVVKNKNIELIVKGE